MTRGQSLITAILAGVLVGSVLEPALGRWMAIVVAVAVAAAIDAGGRRLRPRSGGENPRPAGRRRRR